MGWTDERVERCLKLWADGWSATAIARDLGGITRNAVLGKIHRKGKAERHTASKPSRPARPPRPAPVLQVAAPSPPRPLAVKLAGNGTVFTEPETPRPPREVVALRAEGPGSATSLTLGAYQCKWPIGDPRDEDFTHCGDRALDGPYCDHHATLAYQASTPTSRRARTPDELFRSIRRYV